jgi:hypothetical protein
MSAFVEKMRCKREHKVIGLVNDTHKSYARFSQKGNTLWFYGGFNILGHTIGSIMGEVVQR